MNIIQIYNPKKLVFGADSLDQFVADFLKLSHKRLYLVTIPPMIGKLGDTLSRLTEAGVATSINTTILDEPTFEDFERLIAEAVAFGADSVVGIGGGSVMDIAKLIAAQLHSEQTVDEVLSNGFQKQRSTYVACLPTTAGTGSEVSPNAIFVNSKGSKIGVISPELVPDAAYIDPALTTTVPPSVTAATGIDALAHCIEAYTNKFAHPVIDLLALEGVKLLGGSLLKAYQNGEDDEARTNVALGSMYGGMCLGPVNTAAVHALAYPLSTEFHIPHGLSVALLLPYVMEFNIAAIPDRYAAVAVALGNQEVGSHEDIARSGVRIIKELIRNCGLPGSLADVNIPFEAIEKLAAAAMPVQRLLKNNPRAISLSDAGKIYTSAFNMQEYEEKI
ncbi:iron-containing alcohol dehydrogenase [Dyadobacter psychrophilus]|uniref:Alcohol dehydrogenase, class IV n=1 Tax=Dyadobacter psychrophilus TaxID=651661 RepID=A0A1T5E044_9BACT|nr:iron-containing alcohol dehydrogenase [Dyadobacter psychrophilus]SKB77361.1 Alcohol dehydrogenase, class IV [Dyadobacter psychrophilus]